MKTPSPFHLTSTWKRFAGLSTVLLLAHTASAATLSFNTNADYDNNFYEVANGGDLGTSVGNGYLYKSNASATSAVYNTHSTGGSGGAGGTAGGTPIDTFGDFTIEATFRASALEAGGTSIGFFTKIDDVATPSGYAAILRLTNSTTADFRLFDTAALSAVGGQIGTTQTISGSFAKDTYYIFKLTVTDVGANVRFDGSLFTNGGTQIGSTVTLTDTSSAVTGLGQVGLRVGSGQYTTIQIDKFSVTAIPEPSTCALLASGSALLVAGLRRKRSQL